MEAAERLLNRGFGRPPVSAELTADSELRQEVFVRWLPPDPNDKSKVIEPEPD